MNIAWKDAPKLRERSIRMTDRVVALAVFAALLPIVIEPHVAITKIAQGSGLTVDNSLLGHHADHNLLDELLVDVEAIEIPRAPTHRRRYASAIINPNCRGEQRDDHAALWQSEAAEVPKM